jgi:hypothetical protein
MRITAGVGKHRLGAKLAPPKKQPSQQPDEALEKLARERDAYMDALAEIRDDPEISGEQAREAASQVLEAQGYLAYGRLMAAESVAAWLQVTNEELALDLAEARTELERLHSAATVLPETVDNTVVVQKREGGEKLALDALGVALDAEDRQVDQR